MNQRIRVGIIGLGRSGWSIHALGLSKMPDRYDVTVVADPVAERRREAVDRFGCVAVESAESVIDHPAVDVVVVASPSHTHLPLGLAALRAGKHVVIEKPMAQTTDEVDDLIATAHHAGRLVTCFQNNRFEASFQTVAHLIRSGRIGEPVLIRRTIHRYARRTDWQTLRHLGGGELSNQTSHYLDQLLALVDDPVRVTAADLRRTVSAGDAEDHVKLVLTSGGPLVEIETSATIALPQPTWFVAGTAGGITGSMTELTVRWLDPDQLPDIAADDGPAANRRYGSGEQLPWQNEIITIPPRDRTHAFYDNLHEAIHGHADLAITPDSIRRQIAILTTARELAAAPAGHR